MKLNIHRIDPFSRANGPGTRYTIWVQGCTLACKGCWNPKTWSTQTQIPTGSADLIEEIAGLAAQLDGVTFTGGEPFQQAEGLIPVAEAAQNLGLNVFIFTGYQLADLHAPSHHRLLRLTDWLVDGRFELANKSDGDALRGSRNQRIHYLSPRAFNLEGHPIPVSEVVVHEDGSLHLSGFPNSQLLKNMKKL